MKSNQRNLNQDLFVMNRLSEAAEVQLRGGKCPSCDPHGDPGNGVPPPGDASGGFHSIIDNYTG